MLRSNEYWRQRFEELEDREYKKGAEYYESLGKEYAKAKREVEKEISAWYRRFADNNKMSLYEAKKLLKANELKEFKWSVKEYLKKAEENIIDQRFAKELENASAKVHISRLEALNMQIRMDVDDLYGQMRMDDVFTEAYADQYYHTAFEIAKGVSVGVSLPVIPQTTVDKVLTKPWTFDNRTFSDRLWVNKASLLNELQTGLTQNLMRGESPDALIKKIAKSFDVDLHKAGRLVMTESAYFSSLARKKCFDDLGVEEYEIVATLDNRTSEICQSLDGKVYPKKDFEIGVTAPPFHPNCRTTYCPYFDDMQDIEERWYRDDKGNTGTVPASMKYKEWYDKYIDKPKILSYNKYRNNVNNTIKNDYKLTLNRGQQDKHIKGTNNYIDSRSELIFDAGTLFEKYGTKSSPLFTRNKKWNEKEYFSHSSNIGYYRNEKGEETLTKNGIIHYSKTRGYHIVPAKPKRKGEIYEKY